MRRGKWLTSSFKQTKLSPVQSRSDAIGQLIYQALWSEVRDAEPSPQVWENICQQIAAADRARRDQNPVTFLSFLFDGATRMFNEFLYDRSWETRMAEYRMPIFLSDLLFSTA
jgi:hypothetical protein